MSQYFIWIYNTDMQKLQNPFSITDIEKKYVQVGITTLKARKASKDIFIFTNDCYYLSLKDKTSNFFNMNRFARLQLKCTLAENYPFLSNIMEQFETCDNYGLLEQTHKKFQLMKQPYLVGYFQAKHSDPETTFEVSLEKNVLRFSLKNYKSLLTLTFWARLCVIRNREKKIIGFKICEKSKTYYFYSQDQNKIEEWKRQLCKNTIVWGFYEDYKPIEKIGKGGTASVFLALRRKDNEKVAIKAFFKNQLKNEAKSLEALQNQIKILRSLQNPFLLKYQAVYETDKSYYLITQYFQGRTLTSLIEERLFSYDQSKKIVKSLCLALKYLHKKDIAHRDIKPDNILIEQSSLKPCIVDFGLATCCKNTDYLYQHCGTPGYVAPEILQGQHKIITPAVDIFSLGIVFHLLLCRKFPYAARNIQEILKQNKNADFSFKSLQYSTIPQEGIELMSSMLKPHPNQRIKPHQLIKRFGKKNKLWDFLVQRAPKKLQNPEYQTKWEKISNIRINAIRSETSELSKHKITKKAFI